MLVNSLLVSRANLFQAQRLKHMADDSMWIVDHTIQIGQEKPCHAGIAFA